MNSKLINEQINKLFAQVRVVKCTLEGVPADGLMPIEAALLVAKNAKLDLVLMNTKAGVCTIMDYKKYLFDAKKREKDNSKTKASTKIKSINLDSLDITEHDMSYRASNMIEFIKNTGKSIAYLRIKGGRAMSRKNEGRQVLKNYLAILNTRETLPEGYTCSFSNPPALNGNRWSCTIQFTKIKKN